MVVDEGASQEQSSMVEEKGNTEVIESKKLEIIVTSVETTSTIQEENNLGKLKKTLSERCPECGGVLQVRVYQEGAIEEGEDYLKDVEYIVCKNQCGYEREMEQKRKRRKQNMRDKEDDFDGASDKRRNRTPKNTERYRGTSNRKSKYRNSF